MRFERLNNIIGWGVFLIATFVYLSTIEPTTSFWDCGEYIAVSYKLEVGHPPGAPFFMLVARVFSSLASPQNAALMVNAMSGICSAFAILFLFWSTTLLTRKIAEKDGEGMDFSQQVAVLGSGFIGAFAFIFSDTFWFSAVEGEVYAMSAMFTAVVFWLILKWERHANEPHQTRYIILISYVIGLSIGVHLMNILAIPAIALVYYFKKYQPSVQGGITALIVSGLMIIAFQVVVITGFFEMAGSFEIFMVNSLGMPFNVGTAIYFIALFALIAYGLYYSHKHKKVLMNTILLALTVIMIGYSSYAMIVIRSAADPPMDENNPENLITLVSYLKREQYGSRPILYGQYWNAPVVDQKEGPKTRMKAFQVVPESGGKAMRSFKERYEAEDYIEKHSRNDLTVRPQYIVKDARKERVYHDDFTVPFQRMYDSKHAGDYKKWIDPDDMVMTNVTDRQGNQLKKPQWWQNLEFYSEYQLGWMYWRYFMWNFAGRQNDQQGFAGSMLNGNWLTGIDFIDKERLGNRKEITPRMKEHESYNTFYYLPLILGLIGFFFQLVKAPKSWVVVTVLFLITGIAIVTYLNQPPHEPRERDYTNVGSYYTFAIWMGLGIYALYDAARNMTGSQFGQVAKWALGTSVGIWILSFLADGSKTLPYSLLYIAAIALVALGVMYLLGSKVRNRVALAGLAILIGLPVPYVMAKDGWRDHDRSERYTARDFAKNYLDSCAKNAILFTNGDNDTFPLWYVQEVEEYRTDVRVVNLSLLNTDWYINQMRRKAYDSEAVPFGVHESKYRQGTRDVVAMFNSNRDLKRIIKQHGSSSVSVDTTKKGKKQIYLDVDHALDFVMDDKNMRNLFSRTEKHAYIPSKRFKLDVPKEKVIANGTVSKDMAGKIEDEIRWKLGRSQLMKNSLMVFSLISNFDWERPIYFSVTVGGNAYLGLSKYLQLEGLAYRFVPIKGSSNISNVKGRIDTDKMYHNLMNEFQWGNMDGEDRIYMDDDNLRMTTNLRLQFSNLAEGLIREGKKDSAEKVLDKCVEVMPRHHVPYDRIMTAVAEKYYKVGADEKANRISKILFEKFEEKVEYFMSLEPKFRQNQQIRRNERLSLFLLRRLKMLTNQKFPQEELGREFSKRYNNLIKVYQQNSSGGAGGRFPS